MKNQSRANMNQQKDKGGYMQRQTAQVNLGPGGPAPNESCGLRVPSVDNTEISNGSLNNNNDKPLKETDGDNGPALLGLSNFPT